MTLLAGVVEGLVDTLRKAMVRAGVGLLQAVPEERIRAPLTLYFVSLEDDRLAWSTVSLRGWLSEG